MAPNATAADVRIDDQGSVVVFTPLTPRAQAWVRDHVQLEPWQWLGTGFAVDHRFADLLCNGLSEDGLIVTT